MPDPSFGRVLDKIGMSQTGFGNLIGASPQVVSSWVHGACRPPPDVLEWGMRFAAYIEDNPPPRYEPVSGRRWRK